MLNILELYDIENIELKEIQKKNFTESLDFFEEIIENNYDEQVQKITIKLNKRFGKQIKFLRYKENSTIYYLKFKDYFKKEKSLFIDYLKKSILEEPSNIKAFCVLDILLIIGVIKKDMTTLIELGLAVDIDCEDIKIIDQKKSVNQELGNELLRFLV